MEDLAELLRQLGEMEERPSVFDPIVEHPLTIDLKEIPEDQCNEFVFRDLDKQPSAGYMYDSFLNLSSSLFYNVFLEEDYPKTDFIVDAAIPDPNIHAAEVFPA